SSTVRQRGCNMDTVFMPSPRAPEGCASCAGSKERVENKPPPLLSDFVALIKH
ncbi:uncharacterized, partial [Tachysurus ichikawai]